jgi:hypothetical protein
LAGGYGCLWHLAVVRLCSQALAYVHRHGAARACGPPPECTCLCPCCACARTTPLGLHCSGADGVAHAAAGHKRWCIRRPAASGRNCRSATPGRCDLSYLALSGTVREGPVAVLLLITVTTCTSVAWAGMGAGLEPLLLEAGCVSRRMRVSPSAPLTPVWDLPHSRRTGTGVLRDRKPSRDRNSCVAHGAA